MMLSQEKLFKIDSKQNIYKHIGILIYALRLCFHSFTIDNGFKTNFYSRLLDPNGDLFSLLSSHYIPGSFRGEKGIDIINTYNINEVKENNNEIGANNADKKFQIKPLTLTILKFLFNSHLLFAALLRKSEDEYYIYYSTFNPLNKIFDLWEKLYKLIPGTENNKVEIFLNRINKDIAKMYNKCQNLEEEKNRTIFENNFDNYINECIKDYDYFKLIYYNSSIKAIIQEDNYPLSYNNNDFPYINYFVVSHYPKMDDLKEKRKQFKTKNEWDLCMIDSILKNNNYKNNNNTDNIKDFFLRKYIQIYIKFFSLNPYIDEDSFILSSELFFDNDNFLFKCQNCLNNITEDIKKEYYNKIKNYNKNALMENNNKFLENVLKKIKNKNEYLYKNIRRKININSFYEEQVLTSRIDKISNYSSDIEFLSKYIYKDVFSDDTEEVSQYVAINRIIDYGNYQDYNINLNGFEKELICILLPNKRLFNENTDDFIPSLKLLEGNRKNSLYNFIKIYPNYIEKLDQNLESKIFNVIDGNNKDIINIYIENSFMSLYKYKKYKNNKKDKTQILNMVNIYYKNQMNILNETKKNEIKEEIILESKKHFIFYTYISLQKVIVYLTENIISDDLTLYEILNNSLFFTN